MKERERKEGEFRKFMQKKKLLRRRVMLFNMYCKGHSFDIRRQREIMHSMVALCSTVQQPLAGLRAQKTLRDFLAALQEKNDIVNIF